MNAFIAIPEKTRTLEELFDIIAAASKTIRMIFPCDDDLEVVHNARMNTDYNTDADRIFYLGRSITELADCEAVYFCSGWEESKDCQLIHKVCELYSIQRIEEK